MRTLIVEYGKAPAGCTAQLFGDGARVLLTTRWLRIVRVPGSFEVRLRRMTEALAAAEAKLLDRKDRT